jgi:hypothetical protein
MLITLDSITLSLGHFFGLDKCMEMEGPAAYVALATFLLATIMCVANVVVVIARFTNHEKFAATVVAIFSRVIWIFRVGGDEGERGNHRHT